MPDRSLYYDRKGQPITLHDWALQFEHPDERIVATKILRRRADQITVSTVWVGIDRSYSANPHAKPLIFETKIFGGPLNGAQVYYSTEEGAEAGHEALVGVHRKFRFGWLMKGWMFARHSVPMLIETMVHPRSASIAQTALVLWTLIAAFSVVNFFQSLFVGHNYPWAPFNFAMALCILTMFSRALKGHRWAQAQTKARAKLQAEKEAFERMMGD